MPAPDFAGRFKAVATGHVCDALAHRGIVNAVLKGMRLVTGGGSMAGPAVTLELVPARSPDAPRRLGYFLDEVVDQGVVVVIAAHGCTDYVAVGGRAAMRSYARGAAGIVVDGAVRDVPELRAGAIPVFATGFGLPASEGQLEGMRVNEPVLCAGAKIEPGDWVVGDESGVVVVPGDMVEPVLELGEEREELDRDSVAELAAGATLAATHRHFRDDDAAWLRHVE